jgi:hypothetical protein
VPPDNVVLESVQRGTGGPIPNADELRTALAAQSAYPEDFAQLAHHPLAFWAETAFGLATDELGRLERRVPRTVSEVARELGELTGVPEKRCQDRLRGVLLAGCDAIDPASGFPLAGGAATVDEVSGGRFMLGLGAGHKSVIEDRYGLAYDSPTQRMREVTEIVRRALSGEPVNVEGEIFRLSGAQFSRRPIRSEVPIYIAGTGPRVLELGAE